MPAALGDSSTHLRVTNMRSASGRFCSFSFVDRITRCDASHIEGVYTVPVHATSFPASLMAEAVGQLAAWSAMSQLGFAWRPVAGLASQAHYHQVPQPGQMLRLQADLARCDAEAVAYSGHATIDGQRALELVDCVGPMLPMAEFDAADTVRNDFNILRGPGAPACRFGGVPAPRIGDIEHGPGERLRATLSVPSLGEALFFEDHFARRPVFPGTLLLDALAGLAVQLAQTAEPLRAARDLVPLKIGNVKIRSFTPPGAVLQLEVQLLDADAQRARVKMTASAEGKTVATAHAEIGIRGPR